MIVASISVAEIIVLVGLVVIALLFAGGMFAVSRRRDKLADSLLARVEAADAALADARAQDKGWERTTIEAAARAAVAPQEVRELHLVQVVDKPGTDADQAVFRVVSADGVERNVTLGRREGVWVAV